MARDDRVYYSNTRVQFIETDTGNKVSRRSIICGSQNIVLGGKTIIESTAMIRGDLRRAGTGHSVVIAVGRYCLLDEGCVIRPPYKTYKGVFSYYPVKIGDHVTIGAGTICEAAQIGNMVEIGKNCILGKFTIIKDCAKIEDNTVVAPNTVVPSFAIYSGSPGTYAGDLPDGAPESIEAAARSRYSKYTAT